jgi:ectoine hydroxylase-related dioxygenase (phytanoyl-CoA dioxygenase family)
MSIVNEVQEKGFAIVENIFSEAETDQIIHKTEALKSEKWNFRKKEDLFAIRHFLKESEEIRKLVLTEKVQAILQQFASNYQLVKSIYFDKPPKANWTVNWHQDLTISVTEKKEMTDFKNWLPKDDYFSVQPSDEFLKNMLTFRIHLDNCTKENGALRVIEGSHSQVLNIKEVSQNFFEKETVCEVKKGGILIIKPLLWHSSRRAENNASRRVVHLEFSSLPLPYSLDWNESAYI